jgi:hypothetical protein
MTQIKDSAVEASRDASNEHAFHPERSVGDSCSALRRTTYATVTRKARYAGDISLAQIREI